MNHILILKNYSEKMCHSVKTCAPLGWVEWHEGMCKHVKPWDIRVGSKGTTLLPLSSIGEIEKWLSQQEKSLSLLKSKQVGNELSFEWVIYLHSTLCTAAVPYHGYFMRNRSLSLEKEHLLVLVGKSYHVSTQFLRILGRVRTFISSIALMNYENGIYIPTGRSLRR